MLFLLASCATCQKKTVSIELDENPTTGYRWEFFTDDEILLLVEDNYTTQSQEGIVGAGGKRTFVFEVLKDEDTTIDFYYRRSWEPFPDSPSCTYKYNSQSSSFELK